MEGPNTRESQWQARARCNGMHKGAHQKVHQHALPPRGAHALDERRLEHLQNLRVAFCRQSRCAPSEWKFPSRGLRRRVEEGATHVPLLDVAVDLFGDEVPSCSVEHLRREAVQRSKIMDRQCKQSTLEEKKGG